MKIIECHQGTREWTQARLGIPTSSCFSSIMTPGRKPSRSAPKYLAELVAEWAIGEPVSDFMSEWMERGQELEDDAVRYYELDREIDTKAVGFIVEDGGRYGCSPDRLVDAYGGLEIKCLSAKRHVEALLGLERDEHKLQVQGSLLVTGLEWWDLLFYNPALAPVIVRQERDEEFISDLRTLLEAFCVKLDEAKALMTEKGYVLERTVVK